MNLDDDHEVTALDKLVAPGLRLWMLLALVSSMLLIMVVLVCCFMKLRIPRTKGEIELMAARRRLRNHRRNLPARVISDDLRMQSLNVPVQPAVSSECTSSADSTESGSKSAVSSSHVRTKNTAV